MKTIHMKKVENEGGRTNDRFLALEISVNPRFCKCVVCVWL